MRPEDRLLIASPHPQFGQTRLCHRRYMEEYEREPRCVDARRRR